MDLASILIILALAVLAAAFIARPLVGRQGEAVSEQERRLSGLQAERDKLLASVQEMDLDHAMGKIADEDYRPQRSLLVARGAELLREIDRLQPVGRRGAGVSGDLDSQIEAEVARLRGVSAGQPIGTCPRCGQPRFAGDGFCSRCGAALGEKARA